jgi:hypothetical protein
MMVEEPGPRATPADPRTWPNAAAAPLPPVHLKFSDEIAQESQQLQQGLRVLWALA